MPSRRAFSAYQRCGIELRPCTASTSACTDSSLASFARLRLAIQLSKWRSRSSTDLSESNVFSTNAARAQARLEPGGDGLGRRSPHLAVGRVQPRQRGLERRRVAVELDGDRSTPAPRTGAPTRCARSSPSR